MYCQMFSVGRQVHKTDVGWQLELTRCVPAGFVEGEHGMGTVRDTAADRIQVMLHGVGIGARKHERGAGVRAGQIAPNT